MEINTLSQLSSFSERSLRRGLERIQQDGGRVTLDDNRLSGEDLPLFLATLHDLLVSYPPDKRPAISDHFQAMRKRPPQEWVIPETWPRDAGAQPVKPASSRESLDTETEVLKELRQLRQEIQALRSLESRLSALDDRFNRADKALRSIELILEDEDADNNLYNVISKHIAYFNDRLTTAEENWRLLAQTVAGAIVKLADNDKEQKNLLKDLLGHLSPR